MTTPTSDPRDDPRWELVRASARRAVPTPPGLVARVLRSVQGVRGRLLSPPVEIELDGDRVAIAERTLVLLTRKIGQEIGAELGGIQVSAVAMELGELEVLIVVDYGIVAADAAEILRRGVRRELTKQIGAGVPPINVHVIDVRSR